MVDFAPRMSPNELRSNMMRGPRVGAMVLIVLIFVMFGAGGYWAHRAELDIVTKGMGQVIPSSEVQKVQNLEGGIVSSIQVKQGDTVESGQVLMRIDDTTASAGFKELQETYYGLLASVSRLTAEAEGKDLQFPDELVRERPDLVARERQLYESRKSDLASSRSSAPSAPVTSRKCKAA